jgi:hydroxylamine reductase
MSMFCYQCQEAAGNKGCSGMKGVCGKPDDVANLQDLLIFVTKGVAAVNQCAREHGKNVEATDQYLMDALFATITNANFDAEAIMTRIERGLRLRDEIKYSVNPNANPDPATTHGSLLWKGTRDSFAEKAKTVGVLQTENEDVRSLRELIIYGLKGLAAYYEHAANLGKTDVGIVKFTERALVATTKEKTVDELVALTLETGEFAVKTMALLDGANTGAYGNPELTKVNIGVKNNPGILISGHDLNDLKQLLEQTQGSGVDVYTHSEMLPAHYYPELKKYENLVGNYGNAWWKQDTEFDTFNGPILFTTNCIVPPKGDVQKRIFTTGSSGYPGCTHIEAVDGKKDFSEVIEMAKKTTCTDGNRNG